MISTQTHTTLVSGAYSEAMRRDHDSISTPNDAVSAAASSSFSSFLLPNSTATASAIQQQQHQHQRSTLPSRLPPRFPQNPIGTQESLPDTVEYTTATNSRNSDSEDDSSAEITLAAAEHHEAPVPPGSGGYVWPMPFTEHTEGLAGGGEYVGPLFQRPTDSIDL